ncbi:hypothetical protein COCNU_02G006470 [Cocos nucifera]|uniref:Uncharacterized protein n=1 Tax=Cocos nucifera TaxID=13894 RepID=A0A8K0MX00_COCNU|nr:hypothetical protein COCNU_02G006470 [Cocos nucifera]
MCWREFCLCFRPETEEGPAFRRTVSRKQQVPPEPKATKDGGVDKKHDILSQPKANAANDTAGDARSYPKSANGTPTITPKSNSSSNDNKETDFTHKSTKAGRAITSPEKSDASRASTKAMESNERDKIPPKNVTSYQVLTPKDQIKAAGYDGDHDGGESVGRKPQRKSVGSEGAAGFTVEEG